MDFKPDREAGNELLDVKNISYSLNQQKVLDKISFKVQKGDKIAFVGTEGLAKTALFEILMGELTTNNSSFNWGVTTSQSYFPKENASYFKDTDLTIIDWLRQFSKDQTETFIRGWLGRMLLRLSSFHLSVRHSCPPNRCRHSSVLLLKISR